MDVYDIRLMGELPTPADDTHTLPHHQKGQLDWAQMGLWAKMNKQPKRLLTKQ